MSDDNDIDQVVRILSMNNKVSGSNPTERGILIKNVLESDEIKKFVKELDL